MHPVFLAYLLLYWASLVFAQTSPPQDPAPLYVESSVANSASARTDGLAPNTLATLYGQYLAHVTKSASEDDIAGGLLPTTIRGTGVRVLVGGLLAPVIFVSPTQINFIVPSTLLPGTSDVRVGLDSRYGPSVRLRLNEASPALFQMDPEYVVATRPDGKLTSAESPARAGEIVILYATGLGATTPKAPAGQMVKDPASLTRIRDFKLLLNGEAVGQERVLYAGLAPGFAGLYQINVKLPGSFDRNPVIRIGFTEVLSPDGVRLHAE